MRSKTMQPEMLTRSLLVLFLVGICSRGYGYYNQVLLHTPQVWMDVIAGRASAPEQYRIGVADAAYWVTEHVGWAGHTLRLSQVFGIFDLVGGWVATWVLYRLLVRSESYRESGAAMRWFASASFLALALYALDWLNWYQKIGTLPTAALVAAMVWMWSAQGGRSARSEVGAAVGILALVAMQSFVRADIAMVLCVGVLVVSVMRVAPELALRRGAAIVTSTLGVLIAGGVQVYLMKVRYPQASYDGVPAFMLAHDFLRPTMWAATLIYLAPLLWTTSVWVRRRELPARMDGAVLVSALAYAVMWICMGRLDEVRVFLPMALATLPLIVKAAMQCVTEAGAGAQA
ncbi:hypothetical protein GOB94_06895 [Granulicella sp. 5B5]|uniref:hypothetical protein n=1 Tax=Granulicella sp. 5B5 TaxID=1617967 RepID=UPI0015F40714|nr:hypothetical protein [Granulicella sp. 5B5]QMV18441.1 hypothetical protein GOB94_06895 [Granulicella sp. 5B5]